MLSAFTNTLEFGKTEMRITDLKRAPKDLVTNSLA